MRDRAETARLPPQFDLGSRDPFRPGKPIRFRPRNRLGLTPQIVPPCWVHALLGKAAMVQLIRIAAALIALTLLAIPAAFAAEQVDLLLVLASDVSRSVDHPKFLLQRE